MSQIGQNISVCCDNPALCCSVGNDRQSIAPAIWSSVIMAGAGMGDALLYAWLPVEGQALEMSALAIGVLLSVNKFIRFFTNRWIAYVANDWGIRKVLTLGVSLAAVTTFVYALSPALWVWIIARVIWGLSYSALRFSTLQYAGGAAQMGSALGLGRSIQEAGPLLAYWLGPLLLNAFSSEVVFSGLGIIIFLLAPALYFLPDLKTGSQEIKAFRFAFPNAMDSWVFLSSFAVEGLLIVGISRIVDLRGAGNDQLLIASALYISSRRLLNIVISPVSGWLSDQWGFQKIFNASCLLMVAGVTLIAMGSPNVGVLVAFLGSGINLTLVPIIAMDIGEANRNFDTLTKISTSRDMGSAVGSLVGLYLLAAFHTGWIFGSLSFLLLAVWYYLPKFDNVYE